MLLVLLQIFAAAFAGGPPPEPLPEVMPLREAAEPEGKIPSEGSESPDSASGEPTGEPTGEAIGDPAPPPDTAPPARTDPDLVRRYVQLAWRREGGEKDWIVRDGLGGAAGMDRLAAEGRNPLLEKRLLRETDTARADARRERWYALGVLLLAPIPLLGLSDLDDYGVRDEDYRAVARSNDVLIALSVGGAAISATLTIDSFGWKPRLDHRRASPGRYLTPAEGDALVAGHNQWLRSELGIPEDAARAR